MRAMTYNFDTPVNRRNTGSLKWDVPEGTLPMWVADMDFCAAPEIRAALEARAAHGVFGYSVIPDAWYDAYASWWERRHGLALQKEWLIFCTGVVPAISSMVRKLTMPAENVLLLTPVYNIFFNSIVNNGRNALQSPLLYDGSAYHINFDDLERKLADPQTTMMIFCNPHNPVGKIWDGKTLGRIGALCEKHHVIVVSDEIHCDLTDPGCAYVPFASASETCRKISVTCMAPTKAFNLAGLQTAAVAVPDEALRYKVWRGLNTDEVAEPNAFAVEAAIAAFTKGEAWLDELRAYLYENKRLVRAYLSEHVPAVRALPSEATYLLWLDCRGVGGSSAELSRYLQAEAGLYLSQGAQYGEGGEHFLRMNVACPRGMVQDGLERFSAGIKKYTAETRFVKGSFGEKTKFLNPIQQIP